MKRESSLYNWQLIENTGSYFQLRGSVMGDDRWPDGEMVRTSMVLSINFEKGFAETMNTKYRLIGEHV